MGCHAMYFVVQGQLTYTQEHLHSSETVKQMTWFCEAVIWTMWVHQGRMRTNIECELVALDSTKFRDVVSKYHGDVWLPQRYGAEFVRSMNELQGWTTKIPAMTLCSRTSWSSPAPWNSLSNTVTPRRRSKRK